MAKKRRKNKAERGYNKVTTQIGNILDRSEKIGNERGLWTPTTKFNSEVPIDQQNLLASMYSSIDPNSPAFAMNRTEEMKGILGKMQGGLAGLNAQENTALMEGAQREVDRSYQTAIDQLSKSQARGGVRGSAATAQQGNLDKQRIQAQREMAQDNIAKNIDIQDRRRSEYGGFLGGLEQTENQRLGQAQERLGAGLSERNNYVQGINKLNAQQEATDRAAKSSGLLGLGNWITQTKYGNEQVGIAKANAGRSGGGGGGGAAPGGNDSLSTALAGIYKQQYGEEPQI